MRFARILAATAMLALGAAQAHAGGLAPPVPQEPVTVTIEAAAPQPDSLLIPILGSAVIIGLMALAASDCGPCAE